MGVALRTIVLLGICYAASPLFPVSYFLPLFLIFLFALFGLVIALPITLAMGIGKWRHTSRLWMMPFLLTLMFLLAPEVNFSMKAQIADWTFKNDLSTYAQFVEDINDGIIPTKLGWNNLAPHLIQQRLPLGIMRVTASRNKKGVVVVEIYRVSSALAHSGYLYKNYDDKDISVPQDMRPEEGLQLRHIVGKWYSFSG